ncbi:C40 family peptidase [Metabacillus herbersteinensis]|uniref:C40 family peptidase n=1 Tax=Metabacillus herbersteinensis TaxID=283816 RepID=A0ABV6GG80_9BACI
MLVNKLIRTGLKFLGRPYVFNAIPSQTKNFDCSSFTQYVYGLSGIPLPRNSRQQFQIGLEVPFNRLRKGDLLFFTTTKRKQKKGVAKIGHVAIYLGGNKILHTYREGKKVKISDLENYWKTVFIGAKRVI